MTEMEYKNLPSVSILEENVTRFRGIYESNKNQQNKENLIYAITELKTYLEKFD